MGFYAGSIVFWRRRRFLSLILEGVGVKNGGVGGRGPAVLNGEKWRLNHAENIAKCNEFIANKSVTK